MEPSGLVLSMLVFGKIPIFPMENKNLPAQKEPINTLNWARDEMAKLRAERKIAAAIAHNVPPSAKYKLQLGDKVLAFSEAQQSGFTGSEFWT